MDHHAICAFTSKCGYNRNMVYAICNGPIHYGGAEFTPLHHVQGVTTLSDSMLADGHTLDLTSWKVWSKCMKLFAQSDQLKAPLTKWVVSIPQLQQQWPTHIVPNDQRVYVRYNDSFLQYKQSTVNQNVFIDGTATRWDPATASYPVHATTADGTETWTCEPYHTSIVHLPPPIITTFESYLSTLEG
eukprot:6453257-Ditylum_brightwellii.AAC.1